MLKGIEEVCIIDSIVVDKDRFLEAYKISPESGKLFTYNDFFQNKEEIEATVYETELGNKIYYGERQPDGKLSILARNKMQGEWSKGSLLPGSINDSINANYPYVLTDGATIYYAADGENSIGGYDIFVTRYNTNTNTYLTPENVACHSILPITTICLPSTSLITSDGLLPTATSRKGKYVFTYLFPTLPNGCITTKLWTRKKLSDLLKFTP